jgi:hypothetical protein
MICADEYKEFVDNHLANYKDTPKANAFCALDIDRYLISDHVLLWLKVRVYQVEPHRGRVRTCRSLPSHFFNQQMGTVLGCTTRR